jgi:hypothetical protein
VVTIYLKEILFMKSTPFKRRPYFALETLELAKLGLPMDKIHENLAYSYS